jgi:hypothetical protein
MMYLGRWNTSSALVEMAQQGTIHEWQRMSSVLPPANYFGVNRLA